MTGTPLILASTSETRARMLSAAGVVFEVAAPRVDEAAVRLSLEASGATPRDMADALAEAKAAKVGARRPDALVIGSDQILEFEGRAVGKSETPDELRDLMLAMAGRWHILHSAAVAVEGGRPVWRHVATARLHMRRPTREWLEAYLERNWTSVRNSVGGYLIEGEGVRLFDRIEGDTFTVLGLPLVPLLFWLSDRGTIPG
jgi:septum formation protein